MIKPAHPNQVFWGVTQLVGPVSPMIAPLTSDGKEIVFPEAPKRYNMRHVHLTARMMAKIALGWSVLYLGPDGFKPLIREFILGSDTDFARWMGGFARHILTGKPHAQVKAEPEALHMFRLAFEPKNEKEEFVIVCMRLFAMFNGPENWVVVGTRRR
ncbi:hypothetical protein H0274_01610 [Altererythrobacter sp. CC-YST694]|uniref:hypothetical protein n=1 Tax=Altererythrobacter sp. CC-YST694 TaxID=2755038 RepID=UPI001D021B88|nr:hypothetical protein [Altererythrobacter sp. CC-YST694]MCB5423941.1 hypothetical protein [Altererythrobacter sp. CC-YST694]